MDVSIKEGGHVFLMLSSFMERSKVEPSEKNMAGPSGGAFIRGQSGGIAHSSAQLYIAQ